MAMTLSDIEELFAWRGGEQYTSEPVSQLEHALQCALLAENDGADDALVTACLLHDLGRLLHDLGDTPSVKGTDELHQYRALPFMRGLFPDTVTDPIKLHVDAKRYLCATWPGYIARLSDDSKRSLGLQGGIFNEGQAEAFIAQRGAEDAVRLRVWDDGARTAGLATPPLSYYLERASRCAITAEPGR